MATKTDLFSILDGIMDCDKDVRNANLNDLNAIVYYAEACNENITDADAKRIQKVGKELIDQLNNGNGEWDFMWREARQKLTSI